jgi:ABC-type Mn2+/Zn2+ transport system ATPase subunit
MKQNNLLINLQGVSFNYPGGPPVLKQLDFKLSRGNRIGLIAPNGSGKTTLLHLIMGLLKPSAGRIEIFGKLTRDEKDFADVRQSSPETKKILRMSAARSGFFFRTPTISFSARQCWKMWLLAP